MSETASIIFNGENTGGEATAPYLVKENSQSRKHHSKDSLVTFAALKCKCGCSWCFQCFLLRCSKKIAERISSMNWSSVRHVVLTADPSQFDNDPQKAYEYLVRDLKAVPQFCRDLERTAGVNVRDWVRVIEWHRNGFPHWHIFIDVKISGKAGQIGHEVIQSHWQHGGVHEDFIKNEKHFREITGYFGKNGYFEKNKKHQAILPDWALNSGYHIRRYDSKRIKKEKNNELPAEEQLNTEKQSDSHTKNNEKSDEDKTEWRGYAASMAECGANTLLRHKNSAVFSEYIGSEYNSSFFRVSIPYVFFRSMPGEYVPSVGYVITARISDLGNSLLEYERSLNHAF